jgi:hypothetical protein
MPHLRQVGQGHSAECGFFSGYALKVVRDNPGNPAAWSMEARTVQRVRLDFLTSTRRATGQYFVHRNVIVEFLNHITQPGSFSLSGNLPGQGGRRTPESFIRTINGRLGPGRGVMILFEGGGYRHYLDILPCATPNEWHLYDPSPRTNPHFMAVPCDRFASFELAQGCPIYENVTTIIAASR